MDFLKQRIGGTNTERIILLNHVPRNETMPGPKTKKLIIDHISNILKENQSLRNEDVVIINQIANNIFDMYSRVAKNIGNIADVNARIDYIADMGPNALTLSSFSYVYSEVIEKNPDCYIQQARREVNAKAMSRAAKTSNIFSEAKQSIKTTKIGNTMLGGGNSIASKFIRWLK